VDKNPPRLERYDEWGNEVCRVVHHPDAIENKRAIWEEGSNAIRRSGRVVPTVLGSAFTYLLSQSDTGMVCATGMTGGVESLVDRYAPPGVREQILPHIQSPTYDAGWDGAMLMTEIRGGSDLASSETRATETNGTWVLNGAKWFCSNADARAIVTLARPDGAEAGLAGLALFLVPAERADGSRNGLQIRRVKDKLGTKSVPTAEIDFVDAEAYILSNPNASEGSARGLNRMMSMVNGSRLGVATMGLGIMRRSFLEAAIYASHREAFGRVLNQLPMVRERLVNMAIEVEAVSAIVFETSSLSGSHGDEEKRQLYRILVPLTKFRAARRGLDLASQAVEMLGGNGYIENWPVARQLRDAQCHTIWEGTENIICLDVLRSMVREQAHHALIDRVEGALASADHALLSRTKSVVAEELTRAREAIDFMLGATQEIRQLHARRLTAWLADVTEAALLLEQAAHELRTTGSARKAAVARIFVDENLMQAPRRGIGDDSTVLRLYDSVACFAPLDPAALS
jgi:alkylation response protein AidB-like acyl-CoA dehydrogenase